MENKPVNYAQLLHNRLTNFQINRAMVAMLNFRIDLYIPDIFFEFFRNIDIIDPPALVFCSCAWSELMPPGIIVRLCIKMAKTINESVFYEPVQPCSFFG